MSRPRIVHLDGRFVREEEARIPIGDRGFLYGDAIFETIRIYRGVPDLLPRHLERLRRGARVLGFSLPRPSGGWLELVREILRRNGRDEQDAAVRITVTRGVGGEGLLPPRRARPTVLVSVRDLDPRLPRCRVHGADVVVVPYAGGPAGPLAGVKTTAYAPAVLAKVAARRARAFEAVYADADGILSEGSTSNLFLVRRGRLETPRLEHGGLPGITRARVLEIARRAGIPAIERTLRTGDLLGADEAFLTATTIEVLPIRRVGRTSLPKPPGPVTRQLQALYCADHPAANCHDREAASRSRADFCDPRRKLS